MAQRSARAVSVYLPNLRVSHKPILEADSETVGGKGNKVVVVANGVHAGRVTVEDGVALLVVGKTPTIVNAREGVSLCNKNSLTYVLLT